MLPMDISSVYLHRIARHFPISLDDSCDSHFELYLYRRTITNTEHTNKKTRMTGHRLQLEHDSPESRRPPAAPHTQLCRTRHTHPFRKEREKNSRGAWGFQHAPKTLAPWDVNNIKNPFLLLRHATFCVSSAFSHLGARLCIFLHKPALLLDLSLSRSSVQLGLAWDWRRSGCTAKCWM